MKKSFKNYLAITEEKDLDILDKAGYAFSNQLFGIVGKFVDKYSDDKDFSTMPSDSEIEEYLTSVCSETIKDFIKKINAEKEKY